MVATATLALQHQLVERDLPRLVEAVQQAHPEVDTSYAVLKGRSNYACLHRIREGVPDEQGALIEVPEGSLGKKVLELRTWAESEVEGEGSGERDSAPRHTDREWRQVSVNHRECLGAAKCPFGEECFAEQAREKAHRSHLIVTNHSLLAIDAIEGVPMIPDYDVVVIDEAHELVSRVTQAATDELWAAEVERAARRRRRHVRGRPAGQRPRRCRRRASRRRSARPARAASTGSPSSSPTRSCWCATPHGPASRRTPRRATPADADAGRTQAKGAVQEVFATAERMAADLDSDVLWMSEGTERMPPRLCVAPLQVWGPMRDKLLADKTVVFTSATLMLGGDFASVATSVGLKPTERVDVVVGATVPMTDEPAKPDGAAQTLPWRGLDVGSPFDYGRQAILYVARHLPPPGRDGMSKAMLDEIVELSTPPRAARSGCSPHAGPPRPRPRRSASGCRT